MKTITIDVGKDFAEVCYGTRYMHGDNNSTAFSIFIHDIVSDGHDKVYLDFSNTKKVSSCFLQRFAQIVVANHWQNIIEISKDDKWEWVEVRYNKFIGGIVE